MQSKCCKTVGCQFHFIYCIFFYHFRQRSFAGKSWSQCENEIIPGGDIIVKLTPIAYNFVIYRCPGRLKIVWRIETKFAQTKLGSICSFLCFWGEFPPSVELRRWIWQQIELIFYFLSIFSYRFQLFNLTFTFQPLNFSISFLFFHCLFLTPWCGSW